MISSHDSPGYKTSVRWIMALLLMNVAVLGVANAQSGSFIIPGIRGEAGSDFAFWDLFRNPTGLGYNYNYDNPPALLDGTGMDEEGHLTTAFTARTNLRQTATNTCFVISSGALYSFAAPTAFEIPYTPPAASVGEVTNVIFQVQTGGVRMNLNSVRLLYTHTTPAGPMTFEVAPVYRGLDDPQTGSFSQRLVSALQWDLTGLNVRDFKIVFASPDASMPLWQAQLDVVVGSPFVQELGYLLSVRSRPLTRFGRVGIIDKNLPAGVDGRFFFPGESLNLLAEPELDWLHTGWFYNGAPSTGTELPLTFPAQDITVTALFAPQNYAAWREVMFNHENTLLGLEDDFSDDLVSAEEVDHDGDGLINAGEYAFGSDPYEDDLARWSPQLTVLDVGGTIYPALRYRTNGAPPSNGDTNFVVQLSADNGVTWTDNRTTPTTLEVNRLLQSDGSEIVIARAVQPASAFSTVNMRVDWTAGDVHGDPVGPAPLAIDTASPLADGRVGVAYSLTLAGSGGTAPYTWSLSAGTLPAGLTLSSEGVLSGLPLTEEGSTFTVAITDANSVSVTKVLQLYIQPFLISTASPLAQGRVGVSYTTTFAATGGTAPFTWSVSAGSPPSGLTLGADGVLSGLPSAEGTASFTVHVTDSNSISTIKTVQMTIQPLVIDTNSPLATGLVGAVYAPVTFTVTGGTAPYSWTVSSGTPPAGLTLSSAGVLSGTPATPGTSNFTVQVTDDHGFSATKSFSVNFFSLTIATAPSLPGAVKGVPYSLTFTGTGGTSPYTWSVPPNSLPAGLNLGPNGVLTGTPSAETVSNFTVRLTDFAGFSVSKTFSLTVFASYQKPVVTPVNFGTTIIGTAYSYTVSATNYPKTFTITGLPKGLTFVAATGVISGRPSVSGVFNVQVRATNTGGTSTIVTAPLVVKVLAPNLIGAFTGIVGRNVESNTNLGSRLTLTTTINGSYTAKITTGATATSAAGFLAATAPQVSVTIAGKPLTLTLTNNLITGAYGAATVNGWRQVWDKVVNPASERVGYYSVAIGLADVIDQGVVSIPQGSGYATFSVVEAGTLTVTGKTADGQAISSAGFLGPNGEIAVYTPLYTNKGSIAGTLTLDEDPQGLFRENTVAGALTWSKPTTVTKTYATAFGPVNLDAYGKYLAPAATGSVIVGLPEAGTANLVFTDGGLSESATDPDQVFTYTDENKVVMPVNAVKPTLAINKANGAISGKFTLTDGTVVRKDIPFLGQIVRLANGTTKAAGYFLLIQKPVNGQTISNSPILSGGIAIEQ